MGLSLDVPSGHTGWQPYYIYTPAVALASLVLLIVIFNRVFKRGWLLGLLASVWLLAIPIYLLPYTGGI